MTLDITVTRQKLRMLSLCSGIGGADLAAEATGAIEIVGQVEIDPFCQVVLAKHWANVKRMEDIKEVTGHEFGTIDILVAGIPCQGNSVAGKRQGSQDERNLWPETKRIIGAALPRWIVVENVVGLLSVDSGQLFATVLADLDTLGYRVGWSVYGAAEVGAPHQRERVFLVAYLSGIRGGTQRPQSEKQFRQTDINSDDQTELAHSLNTRCTNTRGISDPQIPEWQESRWEQSTDWTGRSSEGVAHTDSERRKEFNATTRGSESRLAARRDNTPTMADTNGARGPLPFTGQYTTEQIVERSQSGQSQSRIRRGSYGLPSQLDQHQWPARPGEEQKAGEPSRTITEKIPFRNQRLKALGNAIVPQQIYPLFNTIVDIEQIMEDGDVA